MPFIPHTDEDVRQMLVAIGTTSVEVLFEEIPSHLRTSLDKVPEGLTEMEVARLMNTRATQDLYQLCFLGAGAYEHHIPAAVWEIATRGEFYTSYTPYQAEASQGTLQLLYEYQTMMANLNGMEVSNASLYDGASALAEAILMAVRIQRSAKRVLIPTTVHPHYRQVARTIVKNQGIDLVDLPYSSKSGVLISGMLERYENEDWAALVVPQPNFFGLLEDVHALTDWAHQRGILVIGVVNPIALAALSPPGEWGARGADIACGEGQPLGIPLSSGGPYFGFLCCRQTLVRQMPGRIVGRTVDKEGKPGFTLTLQAREQHIRRSKATSNICTNQGLLVTAATLYLSLLGAEGLARVATTSHANTLRLVKKLTAIEGVSPVFAGPYFHEAALRMEKPVQETLAALAEQGIIGGYNLKQHYPELGEAMLVCATEMRTESDMEQYARCLRTVLKS